MIADGADDDVAFLVDQEGCLALGGGLLNGGPELGEVVEVPLQLLDALAHPGGTDDEPHVLGDLELAHGVAQLGAVITLDAPRDAPRAGVVGHEHQVASGQGDEGGEGGALVAALLLVDLNDDLPALAQGILDIDPGPGLVGLVAEVAPGDLLEGEEAMALGAIVDEGRLQAGLDAGDGAFVDIGLFLFASRGFDIQVEEFLAIDDGHPQLFRLSCVDQHSFHSLSRNRARRPTRAVPAGCHPGGRMGRHGTGFASRVLAPRRGGRGGVADRRACNLVSRCPSGTTRKGPALPGRAGRWTGAIRSSAGG